MVAVFLAGELRSSRFGPRLRELVHEEGLDPSLLTGPVIGDELEDGRRRHLLGRLRGWPDRDLFDGFPPDTTWYRTALTPAAVLAARYVDYSYWHELSGGTRVVADGAARVRAGATAFGVGNDLFLDVARDLERGHPVHPLILVGTGLTGPLTVLEGHARATALGLVRAEARPRAVPVLLGISAGMDSWSRVDPEG